MSEILDSDIKQADSSLNVQFFSKLKKNNFESEQKKEDVFDRIDYIKISVPGDILNTPERPANSDDKRRFAAQWHSYKARSGTASDEFIGTPLAKWKRLDERQILELQAMRFSSVEAIAQASDAHIQGIGMIAGQSAFSFRDEARSFIAKQEAETKLSEADLKVKAMHDEMAKKEADMLAKMAAMQEQMNATIAMFNAQQAKAEAEVEQDAPRRGRPPKAQEAA